MTKSFPLRYALPASLLILGGTLALALIIDGVYHSRQSLKQESRSQITGIGEAAVASITNCLARDPSDFAVWKAGLLKRDHNLLAALVLDGTNQLLAQVTADHRSNSVTELKIVPDPDLLAAARTARTPQVQLLRNGAVLAGAFPFPMPATPALAGSPLPGVVYLELDLRPQQDSLLIRNFRRAGMISLLSFILIFLAWSYLNQALTRRIAGLIAVTWKIAEGELDRRASPAGGDELAVLGVAFNQMADQVQARTQALTESEGRYRQIVETAYEGIFALDAEQRLSFVNRRMADMLGYTIDTMVGHTLEEFLFKADWPDHQARINRRQFQEASLCERRWRRKDGAELWSILSFNVLRDAAEIFTGAFGMATDITVRKHAEAKLLLQSSAMLASANGIVITDRTGSVEWVNPAFTRMTGYPETEAVGRKTKFLKSGQHPPEFYRDMWQTIQQGRVWRGDLANKRRDGTIYYESMTITPVCDDHGDILHYVAIKEDVTRHRELEAQLLQARGLEVSSQLAGGLAHEFNNLLTVMIGYARLLKKSSGLIPGDQEMIAEIDLAGKRAAQLTRQLLLFSHQQPMQRHPLNLNLTLQKILPGLAPILGDRITLDFQGAPDLPDLLMDADLIRQLVESLAANARSTLPQGGCLTLSTHPVEFIPQDDVLHSDVRPGSFVCLSVADNGPGMDATRLRHIFEPYFTTGNPPDLAGFGLATVYGIAKLHNGWVEVSSQLGRGTRFKVFFPVTEAALPTVATVRLPLDSPPVAGTKTVLVVEDDLAVLNLSKACLSRSGYHVLSATNGAAALKIWTQQAGAIDLLFTDMILPGDFDGREVARRMREQRPELKVLFSSGYSRERAGQQTDWLAAENYLPKPFDPEVLIEKIHQILGETTRSAA